MAKQRKEPVTDADDKGDPEVRLTAKMRKSQRFLIRMCALRLGENLEQLAAQWLIERAEAEWPRLKKM